MDTNRTNTTPASSATASTVTDTGATRLDLGAMTRDPGVAAPTQAIPALPAFGIPAAPASSPTPAIPAALPILPSAQVGYSRSRPPGPSGPPQRPAPTERERQLRRAQEINEARDAADLERIRGDTAERTQGMRAAAHRRAHQRRMDFYTEARAVAWTLFAYACLLVIITSGTAVAGWFFGFFTPPWLHP